ncbi:hypothetical protein DsansV1_C19g0159691 [Dioscorea sansibarensis]
MFRWLACFAGEPPGPFFSALANPNTSSYSQLKTVWFERMDLRVAAHKRTYT